MMKTNKIHGFTLIEFMVASALAIIVIMAAGSTYLTTRRLNQSAQQRIDVQNNLRNAAAMISRDARVAGSFGCFVTGGLVKGAAAATQAHSGAFPNVSQANMDANPTIVMNAAQNSGYGVVWTSNKDGLTAPDGGFKSNALIFIYGKGNEPIKDMGTGSIELATNNTALQGAIDGGASLVLSTCQNAYILNKDSSTGGRVNFTAATPLSSDFNIDNIGRISVSQFYAAAYVIGRVGGVDSLLRYDIGDNGEWQGPELLAKNVTGMSVSFAYEQNCTNPLDANGWQFAYANTPAHKNLPALIQINLTYTGSAQTQYIINTSVRGGTQCANTISYE